MNTFKTYDEFLLEKRYEKTVQSSHLVEINYDDKTQILKVEFYNGDIYEYADVPKEVFRDFADERNILDRAGRAIKKGLSKLTRKEIDEGTYGTRFWSLIRRGNYQYKKIN
jgi:uncharacterized protein YjhX (UPF0386 family)